MSPEIESHGELSVFVCLCGGVRVLLLGDGEPDLDLGPSYKSRCGRVEVRVDGVEGVPVRRRRSGEGVSTYKFPIQANQQLEEIGN